MTRGLLSCNTCCMLFGQLYDGRCATCANRWAALTNQPLPVPPPPQPKQKGPGRPRIEVRICRCCQQVKQRHEMTQRDLVPHRMRGWCIACRDAERERYKIEQAERLRRISVARSKAMGLHDPAGRTCTKCLDFKPWDDFYQASNGVNGRQSRCKACQTPGGRPGPRGKGFIGKEGRECSVCATYKPWQEFYALKSSATGYHASCKECYVDRRRAEA
jgi:hypothetical protein